MTISRRGFIGGLLGAAITAPVVAKELIKTPATPAVDVSPYSVAYNLQAARQDEFGETFYPTTVISPEDVGFNIHIRAKTSEEIIQDIRNLTIDLYEQSGYGNSTLTYTEKYGRPMRDFMQEWSNALIADDEAELAAALKKSMQLVPESEYFGDPLGTYYSAAVPRGKDTIHMRATEESYAELETFFDNHAKKGGFNGSESLTITRGMGDVPDYESRTIIQDGEVVYRTVRQPKREIRLLEPNVMYLPQLNPPKRDLRLFRMPTLKPMRPLKIDTEPLQAKINRQIDRLTSPLFNWFA